ncbi:MAG: hypothetical protein ACYDG5_06465 [Dehalococcoidales bacterium]
MKKIFAAFKRIPILTIVLLSLFVAIIIIALFIGIDSDRGVLVGWLGVIVLLMEMTRRWRKEWQFLVLIAGAIVGAIILSGLHEVIVGSDNIVTNPWLNFLHVLITSVILLFTPMAIIYGLLATITIFVIRMVTLRKKKAT